MAALFSRHIHHILSLLALLSPFIQRRSVQSQDLN